MQSRNADERMQHLPEPMKVLINGMGRSSPQANTASLADQNSALLAQNLRLLHENLQMRIRQSQGQPAMSYAPPGFWAPPGLPAPTGLHECRIGTCTVAGMGEYQHGYQHDSSFQQKGGHGHSSSTSRKGKGAKTRPQQERLQQEGSAGSDSTASGDVSSAASSMADDDEVDKDKDKAHSKFALTRTTVMMRNLPNNLDREQLVQLMDEEGFQGCYNLVYLPMDFKSKAGLGYAFIDFKGNCDAERFFQSFQGYNKWPLASDKVCDISWSVALQGIDEHMKRYRNSPVMHESVPDQFRPLLFKDGKRVPFPEPTKRIRAPRMWPRRP